MFPLLLNGAEIYRNNLFLLRFVPNQEKISRFCFSISKKVAKNAVVRNKMRRAGYRLLKKYLPEIKPGLLINFSFKALPRNSEEIIKNLESILKKSKLIK